MKLPKNCSECEHFIISPTCQDEDEPTNNIRECKLLRRLSPTPSSSRLDGCPIEKGENI